MSIDDPIYTVTVSNDSVGWSYTTTAGDEYDETEPVQLGDGLSMSWGFTDGDLYNMLEVEQASCHLYVKESVDLPSCTEGDILTIELDRKSGVPYMHFAGRITDVEADTHPRYGTVITLIASDPTAELAMEHSDAGYQAYGVLTHAEEVIDAGISRDYMRGAFATWIADASRELPFGWHHTYWSGTLREFIARVVAGTPTVGLGALNFRYAHDPAWPPPGDPEWNVWSTTSGGVAPTPPSPWMFYMQEVSGRVVDAFTPLYTYGYDLFDPDRVTIAYDPAAVGDVALTVLDGDFVQTPQKWRKDRSRSPNDITYNTFSIPAGPPPLEQSHELRDQPSIDRIGFVRKSIETVRSNQSAPVLPGDPPVTIAEAVIEMNPPADRWAADAVTVIPDLVPDDATLDVLATQFYPHSQPVESVLGRPCVVANISPNILLADLFHYAIIVGCTFTITAGQLLIVPQLQPVAVHVDPAIAPGPSYDAFGASTFGNATYRDQGGSTDYIDHDLTYDQLKLTAL